MPGAGPPPTRRASLSTENWPGMKTPQPKRDHGVSAPTFARIYQDREVGEICHGLLYFPFVIHSSLVIGHLSRHRVSGSLSKRMHIVTRTDIQSRLPLLVTGITGVAGYNALHYFQRLYPGQVIGIRPRRAWRLTGDG